MTHPRNTAGLKENAEMKRQATLAKAETAIQRLIGENQPITFDGVAQAAGISRAWLYKEPEMRARLLSLRSQNQPRPSVPTVQRATDASKDAMLYALREQVRKYRKENEEVKRQIEVAYGLVQAAQPNGQMEDLQKLKDQNEELREKLTGYTGIEEENERLRKQNQSLMNEILELKAGRSSPTTTKSETKKRNHSVKRS